MGRKYTELCTPAVYRHVRLKLKFPRSIVESAIFEQTKIMKYWILSISFCLAFQLSHAQSDTQANELASDVLESVGGKSNWDKTQYLQWNFMGGRMWWWDKWTGNVRVESQRSDLRIAMNIHDKTGRVYVHGSEQTHTDSLAKYLEAGYKMWVNDSYWLVMPFKLKDPGTTLRHLGSRSNKSGISCEVLELTFDKVGVTPQNKYHIYVDPASTLIVQWDFYRNAGDQSPAFQSEWSDYKDFGRIKLSSGRGDRSISDIDAPVSLPPFLFVNVLKPASTFLQ